ncbi:hypothetical protein ETH_00036880 [Eimeria tenella]|uniref:Uncharacterized protein n=1 Tax=Eimeria tenella TaxID=5802 RepID=U6L1E0_EIMTE|nr:hypothetical protein ETH_00036880 [Eimeria tenella]CDJ44232.1 hypothetical protein ETH_00036880 [Eimeria tenella]|eukprot:XP_013234981.1 hypothetical protein ETH_00036880 [Eimeria tenella]
MQEAFDSLCMYTAAAAASFLTGALQGGPPEGLQGGPHGGPERAPPKHPAVRPVYVEARASEAGRASSSSSSSSSSVGGGNPPAPAPAQPAQQQQQQQQQQQGVPLVMDAWQRVGARFLSVLPVVSVDGFLVSSSGLRLPTLRSGNLDSRRLPFATPFPGFGG